MHPRFLTVAIIAAVMVLSAALIVPSCHSQPQIIVQMPADAKALSKLPPNAKVIASDRAVLWWTVYKEMADKGYASTAADMADRAVLSVYGKAP